MTGKPLYADPEVYAERVGFSGGWRDLWHNDDFLALMVRRLGLADAVDVLDVGCGAGHWGMRLLGHLGPDARITGLDREPAFFELARTRLAGLPVEATFVKGDALALPFEDDTFDLVTCQTVLIHLADPVAALREWRRVTRPGGTVLLVEPDNLSGNLALVAGEPALSIEDTLALVRLQMLCDEGKRRLDEGDNRVGARLPGLLAEVGLTDVAAFTNDRCISLFPPYATPDMGLQIEQEADWAAEGISILVGAKEDNLRLFEAGGGTADEFEHLWRSVTQWMELVRTGIAASRYHAARGFILYFAAGSVPASV